MLTGFSELLRNTEIKRDLLCHALLSAVLITAGFVVSIPAGIIAAVSAILFTALHILITQRRYRAIRELSAELDRLLNNAETLDFDFCAEGELAILRSELGKVVKKLRDSADFMRRDRVYLTDSIADISHQLRTPLTALNLISENLITALNSPDSDRERRLELCAELRGQLTRIDWLVESMLKLSRLDAGAVSFRHDNIPLAELVRKAADNVSIALELRGVTLDIKNIDGTFDGDLLWTAEALTNILKNSSEHTAEGGKVTVYGDESAIYSCIVVEDNGEGFDPADLPHLFERFYRGKNSAAGGGIGIGLALARMIVTRENGVIKAENLLPGESETGGGARFTLTFYKSVV